MNIKQLIDDDDAVSPVIGVILMVAITVILAAVIGTFVLGLGDQVSDTAPTASFTFDYNQDATAHGDELTVTHDGGDKIEGSLLNASVSGAANDGSSGNSPTFGRAAVSTSSNNGTLFKGQTASAGSSDILGAGDFHDGASSPAVFTTSNDELDLSGATVRVTWRASGSGDSATLGTWNGPDA